MRPKLIGLSGRAGAGKDTVCRLMVEWGERSDVTVRREGFADRLKLSAARIFFPEIDLVSAVAWCNQIKEKGHVGVTQHYSDFDGISITGREFLQRYGTEAHRDVFGYDFWIDAALQDLTADLTVVTDVRFANEAEAIRKRGGQVWCVERPGQQIAESQHASEVPLDEKLVDGTLANEGSLTDLRLMVESFMRFWYGGAL